MERISLLATVEREGHLSGKPTIQTSEFRAFVGELLGDYAPIDSTVGDHWPECELRSPDL